MRYMDAGESHGPALTVIVDDVPAGIALDQASIDADLARRQGGYGRGGRQSIEHDSAEVLSGVRFGMTLGTPIAMRIDNADHANWHGRMDVFGDRPDDLVRETTPRPGHADLVGTLKIASDDCRDILERASARATATRVAAGAIAKAFLAQLGVETISFVDGIGDVAADEEGLDILTLDQASIDASPVSCPDAEASAMMCVAIDAARSGGDSLGGSFTVVVRGLCAGLGGYAAHDTRLTSKLGAALFSIPAIKAVGFGVGQRAASLPGSRMHDPIVYDEGTGFSRTTNNAGGLEGGMTTGQPLVIHATMKPIPTLTSPLATVELDGREPALASRERSDVCAVPAAAVVAQAEVALVLATAYEDKFGRDCMADIESALAAYRDRIA